MSPFRLLAALAGLLVPAAASAQASPSPFTSAQRYDAMGRVTGTISPSPNDYMANPYLAVRNSYDTAGRLIRVETGHLASWQSEAVQPQSWTGFTAARTIETSYDVMGRKVREQLGEGAAGPVRTVTQYSYDLMGRLECTAVRMNPALFGALPPSACTHSAPAGPDGPDRITRTVYDAAGQRLQLREGVGTADEGAEATWAYNANGQVAAIVDGNGNRAELHYDGHGRQDRWTFPSSARPAAFSDATPATALATAGAVNAADYEAYGYDPDGNRTSLRKRDGSILTYRFDALNRMDLKIVPERADLTPAQTRDVHYAYDLLGRQTAARFDGPTGPGITNSWDGFGRLASTTNGTDGTPRTLAYRYDLNGNRTHVIHPDGAGFSLKYDDLNRPFFLWGNDELRIAVAYYAPHGALFWLNFFRPGTTEPATQTVHVHDGLQRPSQATHYIAGGSVQWAYGRNAAGQVTSVARDNDAYAWTSHYAVDRSYTANGLNQYTAAGGASFGYDANGNLTSDGSRAFVYDVENRLVSSGDVGLSYDPLGRLFQTAVGGAVTRTFLHDGDALVAEYGPGGTLERRHAHWVGADVPMASYDGAALTDPTYLFADRQGSIVAHANGSGALAAINRYDEYGIPAGANSGRFQYTGQIWLPELGMYHYKARVYSPTLGRFLQTDPIGYDDQFNLYAYVANDPVNHTDPTGQCRWCRSGLNVLRRTWNNRGDVGRAIREEGANVLEDAVTIVSPDSTIGERAAAAFNLLSPISTDEVSDAANAVRGAVRGASNRSRARSQPGSYTNRHESGRVYHGAGPRSRSQRSARQTARENEDPHVATDFTPAASRRDGFKDESRRLEQDGGSQSPTNYNRIDSPGTRYRRQDGDD